MIGKVRFCSGKVRPKVRQRAVLSPCQCGSGAGIHISLVSSNKLIQIIKDLQEDKSSFAQTIQMQISYQR